MGTDGRWRSLGMRCCGERGGKYSRDPELNALEDSLNINNQNIKEFFQNFMEARALVGEANAQLYPTLTANASYMRSLTPTHASSLFGSIRRVWSGGDRYCGGIACDGDLSVTESILGAGSVGEDSQSTAGGTVYGADQRRGPGE